MELIVYSKSRIDKDFIISALIDAYKNNYEEDDIKEM